MIQLSAIDLWHLCREIKSSLVDSKLDQIYQYDAQTLLLRFHKTGAGKKEILIHVPRALFETAKKPPVARHLSFCSYLRKTIKGTYLTDMGILGFSRTVYFTFTFKDKSYKLICEFYDKGNIILCSQNNDGQYIIDLPSQMQHWSSRTIKKGEAYEVEETKLPFELSQSEFDELISQGNKEGLTPSKFFATKFKLGGFYGRYIIELLQIDDATSLLTLDFNTVMVGLKTLFPEDASKLSPRAYVSKENSIKHTSHIAPFDVLSKKSSISGNSLSELLDAYYAEEETAEYEDAKTRAFDAKVQKLKRILSSQEKVKMKLSSRIEKSDEFAQKLQASAYEVDLLLQNYAKGKKDARIVSEDKKHKTIKVNI